MDSGQHHEYLIGDFKAIVGNHTNTPKGFMILGHDDSSAKNNISESHTGLGYDESLSHMRESH